MPFDTENCIKYEANYLVGYTSEKREILELLNKSDIERNKIKSLLK